MLRFRKTKAMQIATKYLCLLLILFVSLVGTSISAVNSRQDKQNAPKPKPASKQSSDTKQADDDTSDKDQDEPVDEDLAPAAVQIDVSKSSPLIQTLYQATRETNGLPPTHAVAVSLSRKADLAPGDTLSVRLDVPVYSDRSRTGDPITGTVTYPLCKGGENIKCNDGQYGELLVPPGTKVNGTILFAAKAPDKYSRPRLVLDFSNIVHRDGKRSPLYARVIDVDNARETVRNNEILGIIQPHASSKATITFAAISAANLIAGYAIKGVQTAYGLSIRREIQYPSGTDLQIQIIRPSVLKEKETWIGWKQLPVDAALQKLVAAAPLRTMTPSKVPSDPTNLMFLGTRTQLAAAFGEAGWFEADNVNVKSALKAAQATVRQSGYTSGPMSTLLLEDRPPDAVFQKSLNTFSKRHHLRIWKRAQTYNGQEVWIAAATHDIDTTKKPRRDKMVSPHRPAHRPRARMGRHRFTICWHGNGVCSHRSPSRTEENRERYRRRNRDRRQNLGHPARPRPCRDTSLRNSVSASYKM